MAVLLILLLVKLCRSYGGKVKSTTALQSTLPWHRVRYRWWEVQDQQTHSGTSGRGAKILA